jgi:hypothetical protein
MRKGIKFVKRLKLKTGGKKNSYKIKQKSTDQHFEAHFIILDEKIDSDIRRLNHSNFKLLFKQDRKCLILTENIRVINRISN